MRARKIAGITREIPPTEIFGDADGGDIVMLGWGSTYGPIREAVKQSRAKGKRVSHVHLRYLNPLPGRPRGQAPQLQEGDGRRDEHGTTAEDGARRLPDRAIGINKIQGRPFKVAELVTRISRALEE